MPSFSSRSLRALESADPLLQELFKRVVQNYDCTVLCGYRGPEEQEEAFRAGRSKARWGQSKHNLLPSLAVDVVPYPIDWNDMKRFYHFAGYVWRVAEEMKIRVRSGVDWNGNLNFKDQNFHDAPHWELVDAPPLAVG